MKSRTLFLCMLACLTIPWLAAAPAWSDSLLVTDANGTTVLRLDINEANQLVYCEVAGTCASSPLGGSGTGEDNTVWYFNVPGLAVAPAWIMSFYDPATSMISDVFGSACCAGPGQVLFFNSDGEGVAPYLATEAVQLGYPSIAEPLGYYDITPALAPTYQAQGWHAYFASEIPEPATFGLIGFGIACLVAARKRILA